MVKVEANDWNKHKEMMRRYFMEDVTIKITGETNENFTVEFIIDMEDFYLKSSFIAIKKRINNWLQQREV